MKKLIKKILKESDLEMIDNDGNKEFSEKEKALRTLLREFWYQAISRNDMNKLNDSENTKRLNSKDFDLHFERFLKGELPEKMEDILR